MTTLLDKQQLRAYAARHRVDVTNAQFDDWKGQHLLPESTPSDQKGRGRPRLLYPEIAGDALIWLGRYRKFIDGDDVARFWLWLEGFDYVQVDPGAVVLQRIQVLWQEMQREGMPSLPDIATVAEHGIPENLRETLLDELEERVAYPNVKSGRWTEVEAGKSSLIAALVGVLPSSSLVQDPGTSEFTTQDGLAADALLTEDTAPWRTNLVKVLPTIIEAAQLMRLYRLVMEGKFRPEGLREVWHLFTPEALWSAAARVTPIRVQGKDKPRDRGDFMRLLNCEPLALVLFVITVTTNLEALGRPQFAQAGEEVLGTRGQ